MNIWKVLEIPKCRDANLIKKAYYQKLQTTNPEDHPEEFKVLRQALEEALKYAKGEIGESLDIQEFLDKVDEIYQNYEKRIQVDSWKELFESEILETEEMKNLASTYLLKYIAKYSFFPHEVLYFFNETFEWLNHIEELSKQFPRAYLEFIISNIQYEDIFDYDKLPILEDLDYDQFINEYFDYRRAYAQEDKELCLKLYQEFKKYPFDNLNVDTISFCVFLHMERKPLEAEKIIQKWFNKEPKAYENLSNRLGFFYQCENRFEDAVQCYKDAISKCDSNYENYVSLLRCLRRMSCYEEALPIMEEASRKFPKEAVSLQCRIADLYFDMGDYENAIATYQLLSEVEGMENQYFTDIGFCYEAMETEDDKAKEYYLRGIEKNPEDAEGYRAYGMFLYDRKCFKEAVTYLKQAYQIDPENGFVSLCLGKACKETGELNAANVYFEISLSIAKKELEEDKEDTCVLEMISDALVQLESLEEAVEYADKALKNQYCVTSCPGKGCFEAYEHMAQVAEKQGKKEEALKFYEIAEELKHRKRFAKAIHRLKEEINE